MENDSFKLNFDPTINVKNSYILMDDIIEGFKRISEIENKLEEIRSLKLFLKKESNINRTLFIFSIIINCAFLILIKLSK